MSKLYTAISVQQYRELLQANNLPLLSINDGQYGLLFSEDKQPWIDAIKNQEDQEDVSLYEYAFLIEFEVDPRTVNNWMQDKAVSRLSEKMVEYYQSIGKVVDRNIYSNEETNVLSIMDIWLSEETEDGISQLWLLSVDSSSSPLWKAFTQSIFKISSIGGVPGALEAVKESNQDSVS